MNEIHNATNRLVHAEADMIYALHCFGDFLARREGYQALDKIDAAHYYLMQKHGWTPAAVRTMSPMDLRFALEEEMHGWVLPPEARP